jgi:hypothetical protein
VASEGRDETFGSPAGNSRLGSNWKSAARREALR